MDAVFYELPQEFVAVVEPAK